MLLVVLVGSTGIVVSIGCGLMTPSVLSRRSGSDSPSRRWASGTVCGGVCASADAAVAKAKALEASQYEQNTPPGPLLRLLHTFYICVIILFSIFVRDLIW